MACACADLGYCTYACGTSDCAFGWCGSSCTGCGSGCANGCGDGCTDSCSGCGSGCASGCDGTCKDGCKETCDGTCKDSCKESCSNFCNTGCETETAISLSENLLLTKKFEANNINDIAEFIYLEAARRPHAGVPTEIIFNSKMALQASDIQTLINNLALTNQVIDYTSESGKIASAALGKNLIDKALESYKEEVLLE